MLTKIWKVDNYVENLYTYPQIKEAANELRKNELVAFPTETVYGLGANAHSDHAVQKIYRAKGRPSDNPLIVHISKKEDVDKYALEVPEKARKLIEQFWPGPLTIILNVKQGLLSTYVTAGLPTVGIRMPSHPVALALIEASGLPIAAPSANLSGKPSPTTFQHVNNDLHGKIAGIVDGGETGVGVESTVIDCTEGTPVILRPGGVTREEIENIIGPVAMDKQVKEVVDQPKSPGMKYTHYAPDAPMYLVEGSPTYIQQLVNNSRNQGKRVGVLTTDEQKNYYKADVIVCCGKRDHLSTVAHNLYSALRQFNDKKINIIYSETFPREGIGVAIMNRLLKAAGHRVIKE
ncbi:L-threonylcarbamoyladenylate synthase [Bacillus andreraoultii]|uniref:L-threonylcarbamoyladenylate synthase n=1 Tax=Bacillus andreraoultii TaxID=1499685 RepID=UPI00053B260E|nr:L-threonylcarbamoyladenylate synthase [Bacillus andreraoultii]